MFNVWSSTLHLHKNNNTVSIIGHLRIVTNIDIRKIPLVTQIFYFSCFSCLLKEEVCYGFETEAGFIGHLWRGGGRWRLCSATTD